jgi:protocatechuate 3,4-dioxygenase beta subunit
VWGETADGRLATTHPGADGQATPGGPPVKLKLRPLEPASGRVMTDSGRPVGGAEVLLLPFSHARAVRVTTGADGRFSAAVPAGPVTAFARAPGFDVASAEGRAGLPLALVLNEPRSLTVEVVYQGKLVPGAKVAVADGEPRTTGADGLAVFERLTEDYLRLRASAGTLVGELTLSLEPNEARRVAVSLHEGAVVVGVVVDEAGRPLPDVKVSMRGDSQTTGPDGKFRSGPLAAGRQLLSGEKVGCSGEPQWLELEPGDNPLRLTLICAPTVAGKVVDANGAAVEGVRVSLVSLGSEARASDATTDAKGSFQLSLPSGVFELTTAHAEFRPHHAQVRAPSQGLVITLDAGASVSGHVKDPAGRPARGVAVRVLPALLGDLANDSAGEAYFSPAETDENGSFTLNGLRAGRVLVMAEDRRWGYAASGSFALTGGGRHEGVEVAFRRGRVLAGTVVDENGKGLANAFVSWKPVNPSTFSGLVRSVMSGDVGALLESLPMDTVTNDEGAFELTSVADGELTVEALNLGQTAATTARAGDSVRLVLRVAQVTATGRVVDRDQAPVPRFSIDGKPFAAADGRFETVLGRVPVKRPLRVAAEGFSSLEREVASDGAALELGDLVLEPEATLKVTVLDGERQPMKEVRVSASQPPSGNGDSCTTRASGACTLEGLRVGPVTIVVQAEDTAAKSVELPLAAGGGSVEVTLERGPGTLEGTLRLSAGSPLGARVQLQGTTYRSARCDEAGAFTFAGVPLGRQVLEASDWGATWWATVDAVVGTAKVQVGPSPGGARLELKLASAAANPPSKVLLMQGAAAPASAAEVEDAPLGLMTQAPVGVKLEVLTLPVVLTGLPPGAWTVSSEGPSDGGVLTQRLSLGLGQSLTVELPPGPLRTHW